MNLRDIIDVQVTLSESVWVDHDFNETRDAIPPRPLRRAASAEWLAWYRSTVVVVEPYVQSLLVKWFESDRRWPATPETVSRIHHALLAEAHRLGVDDEIDFDVSMDVDSLCCVISPTVSFYRMIQDAVFAQHHADLEARQANELAATCEKLDLICGMPAGSTAASMDLDAIE